MKKICRKTMNDKTIWFGRYLGCKIAVQGEETPMVNLGVDPEDDWFWVRTDECEYSQHSNDCILILKKLKDISNEDFEELNSLILKTNGNSVYMHESKESVSMKNMHFLPQEIDFLRSKGYAIGIPREYYITEEEL